MTAIYRSAGLKIDYLPATDQFLLTAASEIKGIRVHAPVFRAMLRTFSYNEVLTAGAPPALHECAQCMMVHDHGTAVLVCDRCGLYTCRKHVSVSKPRWCMACSAKEQRAVEVHP